MIVIIRNIALTLVLISGCAWVGALSFVAVIHPELTTRQAAIETAWFVAPLAVAGIILFVADNKMRRDNKTSVG